MNRESIAQLLRAVGVDQISHADRWVNCPCPMAAWRHGSGEDSRPSFGVAVNNDGTSVYYCFGCMSEARPLTSLLHSMYVLTGSYPWEAARIVVQKEVWSGISRIGSSDVWEGHGDLSDVMPIPPSLVQRFPLLATDKSQLASELRQWMADPVGDGGRGVPVWVQNMFRLRVDHDKEAVVFPMTNCSGQIFVMRKRRLRKKQIWTFSAKELGPDVVIDMPVELPRLKNVGAWFGLLNVDWRNPVLVVEGEFDVMRAAALGMTNTIGSSTTSLTRAQIDTLRAAESLMLGYDADLAGKRAADRITAAIGKEVVLSRVDWSVVGRKDAGELRSRDEMEAVLAAIIT